MPSDAQPGSRSLPNRPRILITRTRQQASALAAQLEVLGAQTILIPTIEVVAPTSYTELDAAVATLSQSANRVDWLIFTSANAVHAFTERARAQGISLHPKRIAAIGPATAKSIQQAGLAPQVGAVLLPPKYVAESLAEALLDQAEAQSQHFLLVRAEEARDILPSTLEAAGHSVTIAPAYRNITPTDTLTALQHLFANESGYPDAITFTSSSTAQNLIALLESIGRTIPPGIALASIGPITSATLRDHGYEPTFEASEPTIPSLVLAIAKYLNVD